MKKDEFESNIAYYMTRNEYYNTIINNANAGKPTLNHEHISYQTKIVNAMRSELGVSTIELDQVRFIGAPLQ